LSDRRSKSWNEFVFFCIAVRANISLGFSLRFGGLLIRFHCVASPTTNVKEILLRFLEVVFRVVFFDFLRKLLAKAKREGRSRILLLFLIGHALMNTRVQLPDLFRP